MTPRPRVAANFAITADGKATTRTGSPTTYTSTEDKARLRALRARSDAVLAGAATVAAEGMTMGLSEPSLREERRRRGLPAEPLRAVVSRSGAIDLRWKVFSNDRSPLVLFAGRHPDCTGWLPGFCDLHVFERGDVPLAAVLAILRADYGIRRLICEGGPRLLHALAGQNLLDEIYITILPRVFGGLRAPTLTGLPGPWLRNPAEFRLASARRVADELHCRFVRRKKVSRKGERMR